MNTIGNVRTFQSCGAVIPNTAVYYFWDVFPKHCDVKHKEEILVVLQIRKILKNEPRSVFSTFRKIFGIFLAYKGKIPNATIKQQIMNNLFPIY